MSRREVHRRGNVHADRASAPQRHQDGRAHAQPVVLASLAGGRRGETAAGQPRRRGVHRRQGDGCGPRGDGGRVSVDRVVGLREGCSGK